MAARSLAVLALLGLPALCMVYHVDLELRRDGGEFFASFAFRSGGTVRLELGSVSEPGEYRFAVVSESARRELDRLGGACSDSPAAWALPEVLYAFAGADNATRDNTWEIGQATRHLIGVFACRDSSARLKAVVTALNPGGEQLNADVIPAPIMFSVFAGLWGAVLAGWLANFVLHLSQRPKLHTTISGYISLKLVVVSYLCAYYWHVHHYGWVHVWVYYLYNILVIARRTAFLGLLMLIASGWDIIDRHPPRRPLVIIAVLNVHVAAMACEYFVNFYFTVLESLVFCAVIAVVFMRASTTINMLKHQMPKPVDLSTIPKDVPPPPPVNLDRVRSLERKAQMMKTFRSIIIGYVAAVLAVNVCVTVKVTQWVTLLLFDVLDFGIIIAIVATFRLRSTMSQGFYFLEEEEDVDSGEHDPRLEDDAKDSGPGEPDVPERRSTSRLSCSRNSCCSSRNSLCLAVVQQPNAPAGREPCSPAPRFWSETNFNAPDLRQEDKSAERSV
eukprot:m51a1_g6796 hypothetical protein (502) ;mRNA; r:206382-208809